MVGKRQQANAAGRFDRTRDFALVLGREAGTSRRKNLSFRGQKPTQYVRVFVVDLDIFINQEEVGAATTTTGAAGSSAAFASAIASAFASTFASTFASATAASWLIHIFTKQFRTTPCGSPIVGASAPIAIGLTPC